MANRTNYAEMQRGVLELMNMLDTLLSEAGNRTADHASDHRIGAIQAASVSLQIAIVDLLQEFMEVDDEHKREAAEYVAEHRLRKNQLI